MPVDGQTGLTDILSATSNELTYQPLLLAEISWSDGTFLRLASENLDSTANGFQYDGHDWKPRLYAQNLGQLTSVSDNNIVQIPTITITLADDDKFLFNEYENTIGFKGAVIRLLFVLWDSNTDNFSTDYMVKFIGVCNAPNSDESKLTLFATNILNLPNFTVPTAPVSRFCIWDFPVTHQDRVDAALNQDSNFWHCGYSPDVTDADGPSGTSEARGNMDTSGTNGPGPQAFVNCDRTWSSCIARLGNIGAPTQSTSFNTLVQIEADQQNRFTGRFGGFNYDPPLDWRGYAYISGSKSQGINNPNDDKFNNYIPMVYGTVFVTPQTMNVDGDPNSTRFEALICLGTIGSGDPNDPGPIQYVIVNDYNIPFRATSTQPDTLGWFWINDGQRNGRPNRDSPYNGQGDPYGGMAAICIVCPQEVQSSSGIPTIQILTYGPMVKVYQDETDPTNFIRQYSDNTAWCLLDLLMWCGAVTIDDIDLHSWIKAAAVCDVQVTYTDMQGDTETHPRYHISLSLQERDSLQTVVNKILAGMKGMLVPNNGTIISGLNNPGKLSLVIKQTLADQQPTNDPSISIDSAHADGTDGQGASMFSFDETNIARKGPDRMSPTTFTIEQRHIADTPNIVGFQFQDEDYRYAPDTLNITDDDDISRTGMQINGAGVATMGVPNFDQGKRVLESQLAENYRGNPRSGEFIDPTTGEPKNDTGGTWIVNFETSFQAFQVAVGDIIDVSFDIYGLDTQLFRVLSIQPTANYERLTIRAQWHEDDWYLDSYGQVPDPILQNRRRNKMLRPPYGWLANQETPVNPQDPLVDPTQKGFSIAQVYQAAADGGTIASLHITGHLPVNVFSGTTGPPYAPIGESDLTLGSIPDATYYLSINAIGSDGLYTVNSLPIAQARGGGEISLANIYWQEGSGGYKLYASQNPNLLTLQQGGGGTPDSLSLDTIKKADEAMPDVMFDHLTAYIKKLWHNGIWGEQVASALSANTLVVGGDVTFADNEWVGRIVSIVGKIDSSDPLKIMNFLVTGNDTGNHLTLNTGGVDLINDLNIVAGDVIIMRTQANIYTIDGNGNSNVGDTKFINEVDYFDPPIRILGDNGSPMTLTLATPFNGVTGDEVYVVGMQGDTAANGQVTACTVIDPLHVQLNGIIPNGAYSTGGTIQLITHGLRPHEEIGRVLRVISGTGTGQKLKIIDNDTTTCTLDGSFIIPLDATSVFIIEDMNWLASASTLPVQNSDPTAETYVDVGVDNFPEQMMLAMVFSVDNNGNQAVEGDSPFREIFVYGGPGNNNAANFDKYTWNLAVAADIAVGTDVGPPAMARRNGPPLNLIAQIKVPPLGADLLADIIITKFDGSYTGSIFNQHTDDTMIPTMIDIPQGDTDQVVITDFMPGLVFNEQDEFTVNITQVGSTQAGQVLSLVLKWTLS